MAEEQEKQPVYIVNDERVDPDGKPVKGSAAASESEATDTDDTKQAAKRKSQSEKAE